MKKKLIATLVAGAVLSTGVIGLTACGGLSVPGGEEVANEEAWAKAMTDTVELTNYTFESSTSVNVDVKGTVSKLSSNGSYKTLDHNYTYKTAATNLSVFDTENDKAYAENTDKMELNGTYSGKEIKGNYDNSQKAYSELSENKESVKTYWVAEYSKQELKSNEGETKEEEYWSASEDYHMLSSGLDALTYSTLFYETEDATAPKSIVSLYDKFTYNGGVYTADLYTKLNLDMSGDLIDIVACKVTISFKGGYVIGLGIKVDASDSLKEENAHDITYTVKAESVYVLTEIKTTDVSKKVNKDITKAIDEAKADKENA